MGQRHVDLQRLYGCQLALVVGHAAQLGQAVGPCQHLHHCGPLIIEGQAHLAQAPAQQRGPVSHAGRVMWSSHRPLKQGSHAVCEVGHAACLLSQLSLIQAPGPSRGFDSTGGCVSGCTGGGMAWPQQGGTAVTSLSGHPPLSFPQSRSLQCLTLWPSHRTSSPAWPAGEP